jgi:thiamine-phosphate pyrophosphorylase
MTLQRPVLCLVTDRRRLARHLNLPPDSTAAVDALLAQVRGAAAGGLTLVQVREPDMAARVLRGLVREIRACVEGTPARVVVNDRLDVALAGAAHGVHLKATSVAVADARRLGPAGWIVGRSVHAVADLLEAASPDYFVFGAVFDTRSKPPGWPTAGLAGLRAVVEAACGVPVVGIGGVGRAEAIAVAGTGAAGLAGIDLWLPADPTRVADSVQHAVQDVRKRFDSPGGVT